MRKQPPNVLEAKEIGAGVRAPRFEWLALGSAHAETSPPAGGAGTIPTKRASRQRPPRSLAVSESSVVASV